MNVLPFSLLKIVRLSNFNLIEIIFRQKKYTQQRNSEFTSLTGIQKGLIIEYHFKRSLNKEKLHCSEVICIQTTWQLKNFNIKGWLWPFSRTHQQGSLWDAKLYWYSADTQLIYTLTNFLVIFQIAVVYYRSHFPYHINFHPL